MIRIMVPLIAASVIGVAISPLLGYLSPRASRRVALPALIFPACASFALFAHLSLMGVVATPIVGARLHRVLHLDGIHVTGQGTVGLVAAVVIALAFVRIAAMLIARQRVCNLHPGGILTLPDSRPYAYAVPGSRGAIVLSDGLIRTLTTEEINAVVLHEQAHIEGRHDLWILAARICAIANPFLLPVKRQLEFALERIADEAACRMCGSRRTVISALSKVALGQPLPKMSLGIASTGVTSRIHWLRTDRQSSRPVIAILASAGMLSVVSLSIVQWHHIASAIQAVCGA